MQSKRLAILLLGIVAVAWLFMGIIFSGIHDDLKPGSFRSEISSGSHSTTATGGGLIRHEYPQNDTQVQILPEHNEGVEIMGKVTSVQDRAKEMAVGMAPDQAEDVQSDSSAATWTPAMIPAAFASPEVLPDQSYENIQWLADIRKSFIQAIQSAPGYSAPPAPPGSFSAGVQAVPSSPAPVQNSAGLQTTFPPSSSSVPGESTIVSNPQSPSTSSSPVRVSPVTFPSYLQQAKMAADAAYIGFYGQDAFNKAQSALMQ
jgi:hypothetical protein